MASPFLPARREGVGVWAGVTRGRRTGAPAWLFSVAALPLIGCGWLVGGVAVVFLVNGSLACGPVGEHLDWLMPAPGSER